MLVPPACGLKMLAALNSALALPALDWLSDDMGETDEYGPEEELLNTALLFALAAVPASPNVGKKFSVVVVEASATSAGMEVDC